MWFDRKVPPESALTPEKAPCRKVSPTATAPATPSIVAVAGVSAGVGSAMGAILFAVFYSVLGFFNMGLGAPLVTAFYSAWMLPWLYLALRVMDGRTARRSACNLCLQLSRGLDMMTCRPTQWGS
ncbi:protein of unknown function [Hyphomicrobium sp. 1Nfss2.1]